MATIQKRKKQNGTFSYRVMIRQSDGFPPAYKTFPTRQEAKDWAQQEEARRRRGAYLPDQESRKRTLCDLIDRYEIIVLPAKPKSAKDIKRHLDWWKRSLGKYSVQAITPDLIAQCRQQLAEGVTSKGTMRSSATAMGHQTLQMLQRYTYMNATITHRLSTAVHQRLLEDKNGKEQTSNLE